jgi:hypothetical protein
MNNDKVTTTAIITIKSIKLKKFCLSLSSVYLDTNFLTLGQQKHDIAEKIINNHIGVAFGFCDNIISSVLWFMSY